MAGNKKTKNKAQGKPPRDMSPRPGRAPEGHPLHKPLTELMSVNLLVAYETGQIMMLHNRPLADRLEYVEYEIEDREMYMITRGGILQPVGMKVDPELSVKFENSDSITVLWIEDDQMKDLTTVPLFVRRPGMTHGVVY